jgi:hypothetical protein
MARFLLVAAFQQAVNRFPVGSLREAQNLKDFLEQAGGYRDIEVYQAREAGENPGNLWKLELVAR